jgi:hypothetical protein
MKLFKKLSASLLLVATVFSITSCNIFHQHSWQKQLTKAPTCTEKGILKEFCTDCGEIVLSEINMSEHSFINGMCAFCGTIESTKKELTPIAIPSGADNEGMWSLEKIYELACVIGFEGSYDRFTKVLTGVSLKNASVGLFNSFNATAVANMTEGNILEFPVALTYETVSPKNPGASLGVILRADINDSELLLTYTTGIQISAGKFNSNYGVKIVGIGINADNELIVYYSNNTMAFAGKIAR